MLSKIVRMVGGDPHQKILDGLAVEVEAINELETEYERLSEEELQGDSKPNTQKSPQGIVKRVGFI